MWKVQSAITFCNVYMPNVLKYLHIPLYMVRIPHFHNEQIWSHFSVRILGRNIIIMVFFSQVFGGIEEDGRGSFLACVEERSTEALLPLIKEWILPGTLIVSDGWKAYTNLSKHGYQHSVVNHSKEWKNSDGHTTNKIEGKLAIIIPCQR